MVGLVLVSHSRALAEALARFAEQAGAAGVPVACAGGVRGSAELGTDATAIAEAIRSVSGPDGVLVLMDLGSAVLAAETALELLPETVRSGARLCPAPLVEGAVAAAVQIAAGGSLEQAYREASQALAPKLGHLAGPSAEPAVEPGVELGAGLPEASGEPARGEPWQEATATLRNQHGLHLRPAARLVREAARFQAEVLVGNPRTGAPAVPAGSLNAVATLGLAQGDPIRFQARGPQAREALEALCRLAGDRFGEPAARPESPEAPKNTETLRDGVAEVLQGTPVSEGFAAGPLLIFERQVLRPSERKPEDLEQEWAALREALEAERSSLGRERGSLAPGPGVRGAELFEAFQLVLEDPLLAKDAREQIFAHRCNAEQALDAAIRAVAGRFGALKDAYARERAADILDLGQRVLRRLGGGAPAPAATAAAGPAGPVLLAAEELAPTTAARLDARSVLGVLTVRGGPTSHSAVLVRSLGIPCISGLPESLLQLPAGSNAAMDGGQGKVWIRPDAEALAQAERRRAAWLARRAAAVAEAGEPAVSRDGRRFTVEANIAGVADAEQAVAQGAEGVGVLRTEFLFLNRGRPPSEEEQLEVLGQIALALHGRPLTVRTLDIGGDKQVPYLALPEEANPYLGVRGVRLCLRRPQIFLGQLRAVLRAAARHPLRVLFPMVTTVEELDGALGALEQARASLARDGLPHRWPVPVGIMVETPSAALSIGSYLDRVDFVSLGTNDLTQYTLASERGNPALAGYEDALHPAVLALVHRVASASAEAGRPAAVCGEIAGDPVAIPVLAGLGVREFSLNPRGIPQVKQTLRRLDAAAAADWARRLPDCPTAAEVRRRAEAYLAGLA